MGEVPRAGPFGAFLGRQYDPVWPEFIGTATKGRTKKLRDLEFTDHDPYMGVAEDCRFELAAARPVGELTLDRMHERMTLLEQLNSGRGDLVRSTAGQRLSRHQESALALLESDALAKAL